MFGMERTAPHIREAYGPETWGKGPIRSLVVNGWLRCRYWQADRQRPVCGLWTYVCKWPGPVIDRAR